MYANIFVLFSFLFFSVLFANEHNASIPSQSKEHELFLTAYLYSLHWTNNSETGKKFTDTHKAYGLEYIYNNTYSLSYNHFINSREKEVDVYTAGYLFDIYKEKFGLHLMGGYQKGYCFDLSQYL